jgi:outer membrane protein assembly factor BamB
MSRILLLLALAPLACAAEPAAEPAGGDWPCFRGPKRDGLSPDKGLLKEWPKDGPKLLWKATGVGKGFSSVAVVGGKAFTMGVEGSKTYLYGIDAAKGGEPLWKTEMGAGGREPNGEGSRGTPTYDDGLVYGISSAGDLLCVTADKGEVKWKKSLSKDFGGSYAYWRYSESPLIDGGHLICTPGGSKATMVCLGKKTGKEVWRTAGGKASGEAGYSSPVISNAGGVKQYIQLSQAGTFGVDASNGKLLWHYADFANNTANVPAQIPLGDQVLVVTGYRGGKGKAALLTLTRDGDKFTYKEEWSERGLLNKHGGVIVVGDLMFGDTDDSGSPYCAKWKTGETVWRKKRGSGSGSASLTYADGMLYIRYQSGVMALVPAGGASYEEKGSFRIPGVSGPSWAHPVVIGGRLYLREGDTVLCYDVKAR